MRPDHHSYFTSMAKLVATRSTCIRRSVGCILVDSKNHVLATGYNGVPADDDHCNESTLISGREQFLHACTGAYAESGTNLDLCRAVHAEQNAILQCRDAYAIDRAYVTAFPCPSCLKLLLNTSCRHIIYLEPYGSGDALRQWEDSGRYAFHYKEA